MKKSLILAGAFAFFVNVGVVSAQTNNEEPIGQSYRARVHQALGTSTAPEQTPVQQKKQQNTAYQPPAPATVQNPSAGQPGALYPDTPVHLILLDDLRSGRSKKDQRVRFQVSASISDRSGNILVAEGTQAFGTVIESRAAGAWGRRGVLDVTVDHTFTVDGQKVDLKANKREMGTGNKGLITTGAWLVAWPLAFVRGSNVTIDSGTSLVAFVDDYMSVAVPVSEHAVSENAPLTSKVSSGVSSVRDTTSSSSTAGSLNIPAGASLFTLKNGEVIVGQITGFKDGAYLITTRYGQLNVNQIDVLRIESN